MATRRASPASTAPSSSHQNVAACDPRPAGGAPRAPAVGRGRDGPGPVAAWPRGVDDGGHGVAPGQVAAASGRRPSSTGTGGGPDHVEAGEPTRAAKPRADQCWMCPGVLPSAPRYLPRAMLATRQIGSRGTDTTRSPGGTAVELGESGRGIGHVLEHLDGQHQVERRRGERQVGDVGERRRRGLAPRHSPARRRRAGRPRPRGRRGTGRAPRPHTSPSPTPTSSTARRPVGQRRVERVEEAAHQAALDGVGRRVLVVGVAGRDGGACRDRAVGGDRGRHEPLA